MIVHEPFIDSWNDPLHDFVEQALPFIGAVILTAKQYYRTRIRKSGVDNETSVDSKHTSSQKETEKYN